MSNNDNTTRTSGSMAVGGAVGAASLAVGVAGTLFLGGYQLFDRAQVDAVRQYYGTGAYLIYDDAQFSRSGSTLHYAAEITNPLSVAIPVHRVQVECGNTQKSIAVDVGTRTSAQLSTSGANIFNNHALGTGALLLRSTGSYMIPANGSIRATTGNIATSTGSTKCALKMWGNEFYAP